MDFRRKSVTGARSRFSSKDMTSIRHALSKESGAQAKAVEPEGELAAAVDGLLHDILPSSAFVSSSTRVALVDMARAHLRSQWPHLKLGGDVQTATASEGKSVDEQDAATLRREVLMLRAQLAAVQETLVAVAQKIAPEATPAQDSAVKAASPFAQLIKPRRLSKSHGDLSFASVHVDSSTDSESDDEKTVVPQRRRKNKEDSEGGIRFVSLAEEEKISVAESPTSQSGTPPAAAGSNAEYSFPQHSLTRIDFNSLNISKVCALLVT